ncbi:uncharacterized protein MELLADRAFT_62506 [Melampsora larici-populina 98AG31]|uniref:Alpha-type protein kinase domain-containing protein n=1 Tax=Melampsora larici-populina (strain 98AG31 / pathotype 3-4-7) TaxID=747676 RepID=F4RIE2_MELLP|nr:uncharacterized protein MELLADRAFT_62506 [Melampsora larici-populina 98AG31]EGG07686.1 hypothetical protein MELLADRAFT_62506 [Melampsora larici-populina 98AG31]
MPSEPGPYIGARYRRIPQHPFLPTPYPGAKVGLACPDCPGNDASLVYIHAGGEDIIKIRCSTFERHYYRTFKLNRLNHEIALINAGVKYPIPYDPSQHGPPVNINGAVVAPRPSNSQANSLTRPKRPPPAVKCSRPNQGPTATKHKSAGNAGCVSGYCKSCCTAFSAPGSCYEHRPKGLNMGQRPAPLNPAQLPPAQPILTEPPRPRGIPPPQCSQSVRRVGRILPEEHFSVLERARHAHAAISRQASCPSIDEGKVVSLHFVTKESRSPVISHLFETWPVAVLGKCVSLARQVQEAAGPTWDGNVLVWDELVRNWREIPMTLPHRYITTAQNLVVCIPSHRSELNHDLQEVLESLGQGKPLLATNPATNSINSSPTSTQSNKSLGKTAVTATSEDAHDGPMDDSSPIDSPEPDLISKHHGSAVLKGSTANPICIDLDSDSDCDRGGLTAPKGFIDPGLLTPPDDEPDRKPLQSESNKTNAPRPQHLQEWPGKKLLVSSLLEWYAASTTRGTRTPQWFERFGNEYEYEDQTVHRYWRWVDKVTYERFQKWHEEWPLVGDVTQESILVSQARRVFQLEFNAVARLKNSLSYVSCLVRRSHRGPLGYDMIRSRLDKDVQPVIQMVLNTVIHDPPSSSRSIQMTATEDLGWRALPFDDHSQPQDLESDLVFALLPRPGAASQSDALDYQWTSNYAHVDVDQTGRIHYWDGRTTHHAIMHSLNPAIEKIELNACALDANHDTLVDHLHFAQMFVHAACLFDKFRGVLVEEIDFTPKQNKRLKNMHNVVLCKRNDGDIEPVKRWFNLREPLAGTPAFITSDCQFEPRQHAKGFVGEILACFTHWSYEYHGRHALICGFRGIGDVITDLTIMDDEYVILHIRPWFLDNTFTGGLQSFASKHQCSSPYQKKIIHDAHQKWNFANQSFIYNSRL